MSFLPDVRIFNPATYEEGQSFYLASGIFDNVRIHCVHLEDGSISPGLFVGGTYFPVGMPAT